MPSFIMRLQELLPHIASADDALRQIYGTENFAYAENFPVAKQQLLKLLEAIFQINNDAFGVFQEYRDNLEKNLRENTATEDISTTLIHVKKALEEVFPVIKAHPQKFDKHELQQSVSQCLAGAAENILTIIRLFLSNSLHAKLIQAKRELIKHFALEYIKEQSLLDENDIGNEIHFAHGLFNMVASLYSLAVIKDRFIPSALLDANNIHALGFKEYVSRRISDAKVIHQLMLLSPLPDLNDNLDVAHQQIDIFLKELDSQVSVYRLYQLDEDGSALIPKKNIQLHYEWLLYDMLLKRDCISPHTFILTDEKARTLECIRFHEQIVIVEKSEATTVTDNQISLRLFEPSDAPFVACNVSMLLQKSDDDLSLFPSHLWPLFINGLGSKFSCQLFEAVIKVVETAHDKATASILKNNSSNIDDADVREWLWVLASRGFSDTLLELFGIVGVNQDYLSKLYYNNRRELLGIAAHNGHIAVVEALLNAGANKDASHQDGATPLCIAACMGHIAVVEALVNAGANKDASDQSGTTPLSIAACMGHIAVVEALLKAGANKDASRQDGITPLYIAAHMGHIAVVKALLKAGANKDASRQDGITPLYIAAHMGHIAVVKALLNAEANTDASRQCGTTPLFIAAQKGHIAVVEALLNAEANKDASRQDGTTPLFIAAHMGHIAVVEALLKAGANKDASRQDGTTPIYIAAQNGHIAVVEALLKAGANKDASRQSGATPLFIAAQRGYGEIVDLLVGRIKSDSNCCSHPFLKKTWEISIASPMRAEISVIKMAIRQAEQQLSFEELLRENKLDNQKVIECLSTLHIAIIFGHKAVIEALEKAMPIDDYNKPGCPITIHALKKIFSSPDIPTSDLATDKAPFQDLCA